MSKSPDAFRTISEVAEWLGVQAHVLRFWESKFTQVKPVKRAGGRRYYRPADMLLLGGIKKLLHDDGLTIKGVQKILREQGAAHVSDLSQSLEDSAPMTDVTPSDQGPKVIRFKEPSEKPVETGPEPKTADPDPSQFSLQLEPANPAAPVAPVADDAPAPEPTEQMAADTDTPTPVSPEIATSADEESPAEPEATPVISDPPSAEELPYRPGALQRVAKLDRLTPELAREIAPLARELRQWHDRVADIGTG